MEESDGPPDAPPSSASTPTSLPAGKTITAQLRLHVGYVDAIVAAGGLPVVLPPLGKDVDLDAFLDRLDGFVLTGGLDLDPRRHGLPTHPAVQLMPERRDDSDRLLVRQLLERRLPVLGVGLGMQQLNVALRRHAVPAPAGGHAARHAAPRRRPARPHRHTVLLEPDTRLEEIYGGGEIRVNSAHHQAVRQVGAGPARRRPGARRRHRGDRGDRRQLVLRRRAVAPRIGHGRRRWTCSCSSASSRRVCAGAAVAAAA